MNKKLRAAYAKIQAINDQSIQGMWDEIRDCYKADPSMMERIRTVLYLESRTPPVSDEGSLAVYQWLHKRLMTFATLTLQDKIGEWIESGELPPPHSMEEHKS